MNESRQVRELKDALEHLAKNPDSLPREELQERIRQFSKQAIHQADEAERAGEIEQAVALYELAGRAYRHLAELSSGDLQISELAMADFWETHAELVGRQRNRYVAEEETPHPTPEPRAIHTPKPISLSPKSSIRREQTGRLSSPATGDSRRAERFERPRRKQVGERNDEAQGNGTFRKPEKK